MHKLNIEKLFDLDGIFPEDHGQIPYQDSPKFFELEAMLVLPSGLLLIMTVFFTGFMALEFLGLVQPVNSSYLLWLLPVVTTFLGLAGFALIQYLARRPVSEKQLAWMQMRYMTLGMAPPDRDMNKQDLKQYVEKAYLLESKNYRFI